MTAFAERLRAALVVGVLRAPSSGAAVMAGLAAVRGGLRAVEVTYTVPGAAAALAALRAQLPEDVLLGAGTVTTPDEAREAVRCGAAFLVSPHLAEDVLREARALGVPYLPGVLTPSEVMRARALGAEVLKLFPAAAVGGPAYLRQLLGPFPALQLMVTGGVAPDQVDAYRRAGALAVGLGSNLFPEEALRAGDWDAVARAARRTLHTARPKVGGDA